jgi:hypothetical protein
MLAIVTVAAFAALLSSSRSLFNERQQRSLEVLQQSGVSARDFVAGWVSAVAACGRADVWIVLAAAAAAALARGETGALAFIVPLGVGGLAAVQSAAAWGMAYAATARSRFEVLAVSITYSCVSGVAFGAALTVLALPALGVGVVLQPSESHYLPLLSVLVGLSVLAGNLAAGALGRYSAVKALAERPGRLGFVASA